MAQTSQASPFYVRAACWEIPNPFDCLKGDEMAERKYKLTVTLNEKDYARLNRLKEKTGLTTQAYFLKLFHEIQPKELPCEDFFEVLKVLRQISNNMNQIALRANVTGIVNAKEYWENSRRLQEVISEIKGMMN